MFNSQEPRCVTLTSEKTRDPLGVVYLGDPHRRSSDAPKFADRSQEETERQERCARKASWNLAKHFLKLKERDKSTLFSPTENRCLPSLSETKLEEREFVLDPGASMHMVSRKDLKSAELETVRISRSPTTVATANGEFAHRCGSNSVRQRIGFVRGYSYEWTSGQKPHLIQNCRRLQCNTEKYVPLVVPFVYIYISNILIAGF